MGDSNNTPDNQSEQKKEKASEKNADKKENSIVKKLQDFSVNVKGEFRRVIWPTKNELVKQTMVVLVVCLMMGTIIFGMDAILSSLLNLISTNFG